MHSIHYNMPALLRHIFEAFSSYYSWTICVLYHPQWFWGFYMKIFLHVLKFGLFEATRVSEQKKEVVSSYTFKSLNFRKMLSSRIWLFHSFIVEQFIMIRNETDNCVLKKMHLLHSSRNIKLLVLDIKTGFCLRGVKSSLLPILFKFHIWNSLNESSKVKC